jgi:hypothetical protein
MEILTIVGIDATTAIATPTEHDVVYIAGGRCTGISELEECLRTSLEYDGRTYTAVRLLKKVKGEQRLGAGTLDGDEVDVFRVEDAAPARAVKLVPSESFEIYVAAGQCVESNLEEMQRCIEG